MPLISFINKKTFEIKDELDDYIFCDYEIRKVISKLNKKGYKTTYSCAGHNEVGIFWPLHKEEIEYLDEYMEDAKKDNSLHFVDKDDKYFYHKDEKVATFTYISFEDNYNFKTIPQGFKYELINNKSYISKKINFYKDENHAIRKDDYEINSELEKTHNVLEKWAEMLPDIGE